MLALLGPELLSLRLGISVGAVLTAMPWIWFGRNTRKPKKANHGKRPNCNVNRRAKRPRKGRKEPARP